MLGISEIQPKTSAPRTRLWKALPWALPPILAAGAHVNTLRNPFVFDDHNTVVTNVAIRELGNFAGVVTSGIFRPLETLSFAVDYALWGLNPVGFHLTNLLVHVVNTVVLFSVVLAAVRDSQDDEGSTPRSSRPVTLPFVAAALFAVHPLLTEAVGYVSARGDLLVAMFLMLGLSSARRGFIERRWGWTAMALALFALALGSKEIAIMFPFVLLAYDRLLLRNVPDPRQRLLRLHMPLLVATTLAAGARAAVFLWVENPTQRSAVHRASVYLLVQFEVVWQYVGLLMAPISLSIAHDVGLSPRRSLVGAVGLLVAGGLVFVTRRRAPIAAFGVAWFLLFLVPSSSVIPLQHMMAEHRVYVASAGVFVLVAYAFTQLLTILQRREEGLRFAPHAALVMIILVLLASAVARNNVWSDPVKLWRDTVTKTPGWLAHLGLAEALRGQGRCGEAIIAYRQAIVRVPQDVFIYERLYGCLVEEGRVRESRDVEQAMFKMDPNFDRRCQGLQTLLGREFRVDDCVARWKNRDS